MKKLLLILCMSLLFASAAVSEEANVIIDFEEPPTSETEEEGFMPPIERIFSNPVVVSGLASGADALNRSVESLMDAVFYSLLDNELRLSMTKYSWLALNLKRNVYSTPMGAYVVVDQVGLGPNYSREMWRMHNVPITLGANGGVEVLQIYLRTDGMRLTEQNNLPAWRVALNNWFGLVPFLAQILPPSFNQNELYNPVRILETPFVFPEDTDGFYKMPIGSIGSYNISGGVQVGSDFSGLLDQETRNLFEDHLKLKTLFPYSIFLRGNYRINVFRRSEHTAWIGLSRQKRGGHSFSPAIGDNIPALKGALLASVFGWKWAWKGVPLAALPFDLLVEQALTDLTDQVYEYDLNNAMAKEAYHAAVRGDFALSHQRYLEQKERIHDTGVVFHFNKNTDRQEHILGVGPNLAVYSDRRRSERSESQVEIKDQEGRFFVLESQHLVQDRRWDVLVGEEEEKYQNVAELRVNKIPTKKGKDSGFSYEFVLDDPLHLTLSIDIQDRYTDTQEYKANLKLLRYFLSMDLESVPEIPVKDDVRISARRSHEYFVRPDDEVLSLHVTPTHLGQFGAQAAISLSTKSLEKILSRSEDEMWRAFGKAFGADEDWGNTTYRASFFYKAQWLKSFIFYPARIFNWRIARLDAVKEADNGVRSLRMAKAAKSPLAKQHAFFQLFDSDYPAYLAKALLNMSDLEEVPRRVIFSAQPKGSARDAIKRAYGSLNKKVFSMGPAFPAPTRYTQAKKKLAAFYIDQPRMDENRPRLALVRMTTRAVAREEVGPSAVDGENLPAGEPQPTSDHIFLTLSARNIDLKAPVKFYVRVEQSGRLKLGKLELAEKVISVDPARYEVQNDKKLPIFEFFLTGPLSPLNNFLLDQRVAAGDEFRVTLALSQDGVVWSDERVLEFRYEKGRLMRSE